MLESQLLQVKYEKEAKVCWFIRRFLGVVSSKAKRALDDSVSLNFFESRTSENMQLEETAEI